MASKSGLPDRIFNVGLHDEVVNGGQILPNPRHFLPLRRSQKSLLPPLSG
jgi:hypothetical protein